MIVINNEVYMRQSLELALKAYNEDEVPIGAVVLDKDGSVIGRGYNRTESCKTQTAHAELLALAEAGKVQNDWRLDGCTLFVTLEPCSMCMAAIKLSRV